MLNNARAQSNISYACLNYILSNIIIDFVYVFLDTKTSENFTDEARVECIMPTMSKKLTHSQTGKINQRIYESYYAATDILTVKLVACTNVTVI